MSKYRKFSKEFKVEAVRLLVQADKPASEIARSLGVPRNRLYKWQEQLRDKGDVAFPGTGRLPADKDAEIVRLKRELERTQEDLEMLKKAAAYFAKNLR